MRKVLLAGLAVACSVFAHGASAGQVAKAANFTIDADDTACKAGGCTVTLKVTALNNFHVNKDYPTKFKIADVGGVEFQGKDAGGKNVFSKAAGDFVLAPEDPRIKGSPSGTMTISLKAKAGAVKLSGPFKLSVCNDANCQMETVDLAVPITVK